ncbi:YciI-like protein [Nitratireductor sp. ZSWI3]|uniref:YciI-like protein n=1 Tax=Nitratireductor sp. ZSWI3 TaxID=2966359 RepID=UPI0021505A56|nr:YciI-like protein [Nitratireductor sp. ZSWI3]MCR4269382.1 YciI-like protein [Nitratireductor sp. ZSWI3]
MIFAIICKDKPGHLETRMGTRPQHLDYLNGLNENGTLKFAGPFLDAEGKPCGSLVAIEAENEAAAGVIAAADPYALAGLFESFEIRAWNWVFNNPENA